MKPDEHTPANEPNPLKDPQEQYDENIQEYQDGDGPANLDERDLKFRGRFPRDFYRYSQDFHDREDGAPGIDQDFATRMAPDPVAPATPNLMPEGDGDAESQTDREIREEIMDALTHDRRLDASDVSARVEDGVVTLSGSVVEEAMKRAIENSVQSVPGVDKVLNCLLVDPPKTLVFH
jgi:hypothetical protein